jgi:hypothetical protein
MGNTGYVALGTNFQVGSLTPGTVPLSIGTAGTVMHGGRMTRGGVYAIPTINTSFHFSNPVILWWEIGTTHVTQCYVEGNYDCGSGHGAFGMNTYLGVNFVAPLDSYYNVSFSAIANNSPGTAPQNQIISTAPSGGQPGSQDWHTTWNNASDDTQPACASNFRQTGNSGAGWDPAYSTEIDAAWEREIVCFNPTAGSNAVWRFAHHRSASFYGTLHIPNPFATIPKANISQDGKFVAFTTDWDGSLGGSNNGSHATAPCSPVGPTCQPRTDLMVVELK